MHSHLNAMGITVYTPREDCSDQENPIKTEVLCYPLLHNEQEVGYALLDIVESTPEKQVEMDVLLDAMLRAVKLRKGNALSEDSIPMAIESSIMDAPNKSGHDKVLLLSFGTKAKDSVKNTKYHRISTHHPYDILENPNLKRDAWNALKPIASRRWD